MTKTELKKQKTKKVLNYLAAEFGAYDIERENQYFDMQVDRESFRISIQLDERGYGVSSWDSIELVGNGWTQKELDKQRVAKQLERDIFKAIQALLLGL
jgi:hypothetical protein|tara:strand:- start:49 stop:345 length:297 start_codon:yes stop_codon:yes gene_type:complete